MARSIAVVLPVFVLALASAAWWRSEQKENLFLLDAGNKLRTASSNAPIPRSFYGRRLEPRESVVLHGAGQSDQTSFAAYSKAVAPSAPMLSMSYVDLHDDVPAYFSHLKAELARYPNLIIPQIGLSLNAGGAAKHYDATVASGAEDPHLRQLCDGLQTLDRPIFLRIGYEFNGSWNGYSPSSYIAAFRHIAQFVRDSKLENVALVWDWSPGAELDAEEGGAPVEGASSRYMAYYPGDAWVDWWGLNIFGAASTWSRATEAFLVDADRHRMPVMIAESTPKGHSVTEGERVIDAWYKPYFGLIRIFPGIKAFCYINWDWSIYPQWSDWGDGRVERDPAVLQFYRGEVSQKLYASAQNRAATMKLLNAK